MAFGLRAFNAGIVTRRLELPEISVDPEKPVTLLVRHAGTHNPAWDSWLIKQQAARGQDKAANTPDTPEALIAARARDRAFVNEMLVETVLAGWEHVTEDGRETPFTPEAARRFLDELVENCHDVWLRLQRFAAAVGNFRGVADPVELGKESPRG